MRSVDGGENEIAEDNTEHLDLESTVSKVKEKIITEEIQPQFLRDILHDSLTLIFELSLRIVSLENKIDDIQESLKDPDANRRK